MFEQSRIAVASAAEDFYARAKDLAGLIEAVTEKLIGQAEYVRWWDSQEKAGGERSLSSRKRDDNRPRVGQNGIPTKDVLHRWRKIAEDLDSAIADAIEGCRRICEQEKQRTAFVTRTNASHAADHQIDTDRLRTYQQEAPRS